MLCAQEQDDMSNSEHDNLMFVVSLELTHMTFKIHHAARKNNTSRYERYRPTGRVSIGLGAMRLLNVNRDNFCTYL